MNKIMKYNLDHFLNHKEEINEIIMDNLDHFLIHKEEIVKQNYEG